TFSKALTTPSSSSCEMEKLSICARWYTRFHRGCVYNPRLSR
ncbi:ORFL192C, partial [Human betaherpesvirus 5]